MVEDYFSGSCPLVGKFGVEHIGRHEGKAKLMSFGSYPDVSLSLASERHAAARKLLATGTDPMAERKAEKAAALFCVARLPSVSGRISIAILPKIPFRKGCLFYRFSYSYFCNLIHFCRQPFRAWCNVLIYNGLYLAIGLHVERRCIHFFSG